MESAGTALAPLDPILSLNVMNAADKSVVVEDEVSWFCLKSQPKHEHIAAAHLRQIEGIEVLCPRIRYRKDTTRGPAWFNEALFPGYLFASFALKREFNRVRYAHGVSCIVTFGGRYPIIDDETIEFLRGADNQGELHVIPERYAPGDEIKIVDGAFRGLEALVTQVMSAKDRVRVLIEFLGRRTEVELKTAQVLPRGEGRRRIPDLGAALTAPWKD